MGAATGGVDTTLLVQGCLGEVADLAVGLIPAPTAGEGVAAAGSEDPAKLEVSLTLTNKFEGLETDAGDTGAQSLLLR